MTASDASDTAAEADAPAALSDRAVRGLTERLVVMATDARGIYTVFSEDGTPRTVDVEGGACDCPDAEYNDPENGCKHVHAARFLAGDREIPEWVDEDSINAQLAGYSGVGA